MPYRIKRRRVLALLGAGAVAGCSESNSSDDDNEDAEEDEESSSDESDLASWDTRRPVTLREQAGTDAESYPVVLNDIVIGDADPASVRVVDETTESVVEYAVRGTSLVDVAFRTDVSADDTIDQYAVYYGNPGASDESTDWGSLRYDWYDGFEGDPGTEPERWTAFDQSPPEAFRLDTETAASGESSMYLDGAYTTVDSSVGNIESLPDDQYSVVEFDMRHVENNTQFKLTAEDRVRSNGGFLDYRVKRTRIDRLCSGSSFDLDPDTWYHYRIELDWTDGVSWDLYIDGEHVDTCASTFSNPDQMTGIIFRQAAKGDGIHYVDNVGLVSDREADVAASVGDAESA